MSFDNDRKGSRGASGGDDSPALKRYLGTLADDPLLTPKQELAMGCIVQDGLAAAQTALFDLLKNDAKILNGQKKTCRTDYQAASVRARRFNPLGLKGANLRKHVVELSTGKDCGFAILQRFGPAEACRTADQFVKSNRRLVVTIARRYRNPRLLPLADLIQEGNIGLMLSVLRYDPGRKLRFSTYATWWIRHAVGRANADMGREIRIPVHAIELVGAIEKARRNLTAALGRLPSTQELAKRLRVPASKIEKLLPHLGLPISIDQSVYGDDEESVSLHELLPDERESAETGVARDELVAKLLPLLPLLSPIEQDVIRCRFGFGKLNEQTLREIGDRHNLSRERIRQIQDGALKKLKMALEKQGVHGP